MQQEVTMNTKATPQEEKHVQGKRPKQLEKSRQQQAENPDGGQQGGNRQQGNPDIERNFEDQAR
jgi:hypothetical protein